MIMLSYLGSQVCSRCRQRRPGPEPLGTPSTLFKFRVQKPGPVFGLNRGWPGAGLKAAPRLDARGIVVGDFDEQGASVAFPIAEAAGRRMVQGGDRRQARI